MMPVDKVPSHGALTHPDEVAAYITTWKQLFSIAAHPHLLVHRGGGAA